MLIACIGIRVCEYQLDVPQLYKSEERCAQQAALLAGMVHGRYETHDPLNYRYACTPVGSEISAWRDGGSDPLNQKVELHRSFPLDKGG